MAICPNCGKRNWSIGTDICRDCALIKAMPKKSAVTLTKEAEEAGHPNWTEPTSAAVHSTEPNAPKTGAAILAYLSALIIAICSAISFFVLLENNNGFMGFMVLVSGLGGAIFFMIMAEISHNVASLVRLAKAKKEEE